MKRFLSAIFLCAAVTAAMTAGVSAVETPAVCYPESVTCSEDQTELKKVYVLSPADDPAGIPRADFEQDGYLYTLQDILRQEQAADETEVHTETVSLPSDKKDLESVLALLPQEKQFSTDDGFTGTLSLRLDTVLVKPSGYGTSTKALTTTRSYPNLDSQDTEYIPKSIDDGGHSLVLQNIQWQTDNTTNVDGYALGDRFTAVATYTGSSTSSYVKGFSVTAAYTGTLSRTSVSKVQYTAIYSGTPIIVQNEDEGRTFQWRSILIPGAALAAVGGVTAVILRKRKKGEV